MYFNNDISLSSNKEIVKEKKKLTLAYILIIGILFIFNFIVLINSAFIYILDFFPALLYSIPLVLVYVIIVISICYKDFYNNVLTKYKRVRLGLFIFTAYTIYILAYHGASDAVYLLTFFRFPFISVFIVGYTILAVIYPKLPSFIGYILCFLPFLDHDPSFESVIVYFYFASTIGSIFLTFKELFIYKLNKYKKNHFLNSL